MTRRIVVDQRRCIMAGECIYNHPDHFEWNEGGTAARAVSAEIESADDEHHAAQAVALCPGGAISITEVTGSGS